LGGSWYLSLALSQHLKPFVDTVVYRSKITNQPCMFKPQTVESLSVSDHQMGGLSTPGAGVQYTV
jgi:hypothetical protein